MTKNVTPERFILNYAQIIYDGVKFDPPERSSVW